MTRFIMSPGDNNNTKQVIQKDAGNLYIYYIYDTKCEYPTRVPAITQTHVSRFKKQSLLVAIQPIHQNLYKNAS